VLVVRLAGLFEKSSECCGSLCFANECDPLWCFLLEINWFYQTDPPHGIFCMVGFLL